MATSQEIPWQYTDAGKLAASQQQQGPTPPRSGSGWYDGWYHNEMGLPINADGTPIGQLGADQAMSRKLGIEQSRANVQASQSATEGQNYENMITSRKTADGRTRGGQSGDAIAAYLSHSGLSPVIQGLMGSVSSSSGGGGGGGGSTTGGGINWPADPTPWPPKYQNQALSGLKSSG